MLYSEVWKKQHLSSRIFSLLQYKKVLIFRGTAYSISVLVPFVLRVKPWNDLELKYPKNMFSY